MQLVDSATKHKMWCLTKHLCSGFQKKKKLLDSKEIKDQIKEEIVEIHIS